MSQAKLSQGRPGTMLVPNDDGDIQMEGVNFTSAHGTKCATEQDQLVSAMGGQVKDRTHKPEYNTQADQQRAKA